MQDKPLAGKLREFGAPLAQSAGNASPKKRKTPAPISEGAFACVYADFKRRLFLFGSLGVGGHDVEGGLAVRTNRNGDFLFGQEILYRGIDLIVILNAVPARAVFKSNGSGVGGLFADGYLGGAIRRLFDGRIVAIIGFGKRDGGVDDKRNHCEAEDEAQVFHKDGFYGG